MISSKELKSVQIDTANNGYNVDQVENIIKLAADTIDGYLRENKELYKKLEFLAGKIEQYRSEEDLIKTALISAEKTASKITKESQQKADELTASSEKTAKETVDSAQEKADKLVAEARDYAAKIIKENTDKANKSLIDAQKDANDIINNAKSSSQDILNKAKDLSNSLIEKAKEEKDAHQLLVNVLRDDASAFIDNAKALYQQQLDMLNSAKLVADDDNTKDEELNQISNLEDEIKNIVSEIQTVENDVLEPVADEETEQTPEDTEVVESEEKTADEAPQDDAKEVVSEDSQEEITTEAPKEVAPMVEKDDSDIVDEMIKSINNSTKKEVEPQPELEKPQVSQEEAKKALDAFSNDEFTPIDENAKPYISEIDGDVQMEEPTVNDDHSLFDQDNQQPFEGFFNIKRETSDTNRDEVISLIPDDEDDYEEEPKFKGFFKKKK